MSNNNLRVLNCSQHNDIKCKQHPKIVKKLYIKSFFLTLYGPGYKVMNTGLKEAIKFINELPPPRPFLRNVDTKLLYICHHVNARRRASTRVHLNLAL